MIRQNDASFIFEFITKAIANEVDVHVHQRYFDTLSLSYFFYLLAFGLSLEEQQRLLQMNFNCADFIRSGFRLVYLGF